MDTDNGILATGMTVHEYLNQRDYWLDEQSGKLVPIESLSTQRRLYAARALVRNATAFISLTENERNQVRDLTGVLGLVGKNPRDWMVNTPLYGALYRDERQDSSQGIVLNVSQPL